MRALCSEGGGRVATADDGGGLRADVPSWCQAQRGALVAAVMGARALERLAALALRFLEMPRAGLTGRGAASAGAGFVEVLSGRERASVSNRNLAWEPAARV